MRRLFGFLVVIALATSGVAGAQTADGQNKGLPGSATPQGANVGDMIGKLGLTGNATTLVGCAGGSYAATFILGAGVAGAQVHVDIQRGEGIDPKAMVVNSNIGVERAEFFADDDSGGNLEPRIRARLNFDGNVVLHVGSFDGSFGCFVVQVTTIFP